jgi:hypothetical protein
MVWLLVLCGFLTCSIGQPIEMPVPHDVVLFHGGLLGLDDILMLQQDDEDEKADAGEVEINDDPAETQTVPASTGDTGGDSSAPPSDPAEQKLQAERDAAQSGETDPNAGGNEQAMTSSANQDPSLQQNNPDEQKQQDEQANDAREEQEISNQALDGGVVSKEEVESTKNVQVVEDGVVDVFHPSDPSPSPQLIPDTQNITITNPKCHIVRTIVCDNSTDTEESPIPSPSPSATPSIVPMIFPPNWENPQYEKTGYSPSPSPTNQVPGRMPNEVTIADRNRVIALIEGKKEHVLRSMNKVQLVAAENVQIMPSYDIEHTTHLTQSSFAKIRSPITLGKMLRADQFLKIPSTVKRAGDFESQQLHEPAHDSMSAELAVAPKLGFGSDAEADFMMDGEIHQDYHDTSVYKPLPADSRTQMSIEVPAVDQDTLHAKNAIQLALPNVELGKDHNSVEGDSIFSSFSSSPSSHLPMANGFLDSPIGGELPAALKRPTLENGEGFHATTLPRVVKSMKKVVTQDIPKFVKDTIENASEQIPKQVVPRSGALSTFTAELAKPSEVEQKIINKFNDVSYELFSCLIPLVIFNTNPSNADGKASKHAHATCAFHGLYCRAKGRNRLTSQGNVGLFRAEKQDSQRSSN